MDRCIQTLRCADSNGKGKWDEKPTFVGDDFVSQSSMEETPLAKGAKRILIAEDERGCPRPLPHIGESDARTLVSDPAGLSSVLSRAWGVGPEGLPGAPEPANDPGMHEPPADSAPGQTRSPPPYVNRLGAGWSSPVISLLETRCPLLEEV